MPQLRYSGPGVGFLDDRYVKVTGDLMTGDLFIANGNGIIVGHTSQIDFGATPEFQVLGTGTPDSSMGFARFENNASGPDVRFLKSRGATIGANVIVQDDDILGRFRFQGADGGDFNTTAAEILGEVDGTPGLDDIPGRLIFKTRTAAGSLVEKMRIDNAGLVDITGRLLVEPGSDGTSILRVNQADSTVVFNVDTTNARVGIGTATPLHILDIRGDNSDTSQGQLHFSHDDTDSGGYLVSAAQSNFFMSSGASWNGSNWIAKSTVAAIIGGGALGQLDFYADNSLTSGNAFTPNIRMRILPSGDISISGEVVIGGAIGTTPIADLYVIGDIALTGNADLIQLTLKAHSTQTANIVEIQDSSANVLGGFDERGILFSDGGIDIATVFIGANAGNVSASGIKNIAIGQEALKSLTTGIGNIALGFRALEDCTDGNTNYALGAQALTKLIGGVSNVGLGNNAGANITTGDNNIAIGVNSLNRLVSSDGNIGIGTNALNLNTAANNVSIGFRTLRYTVTGAQNVAIGASAGEGVTGNTFANNTLIGFESGTALTTGGDNIFFGNLSGSRQTSLSNLLIIDNQQRADVGTELTNSILYGVMAATPGAQTLRINAKLGINATPSAQFIVDGNADIVQFVIQAHSTQTANIVEVQDSSGNVLSGYDERGVPFADLNTHANKRNYFAGNDAGNVSATGDQNVAVGYKAGSSITDGESNVFIGASAGINNLGGDQNVGLGNGALEANTTGSNNMAIGRLALNANQTQGSNVAIGLSAMAVSTGSANCVVVGKNSARNLTSGDDNVFIGFEAGRFNTTGGRSVAIGHSAGRGVSGNAHSENVFIGNDAGIVITTGSNNTLVGQDSGKILSAGATNIFLGNTAGDKQTTASNLLIVDNQTRTDTATELTNSILYGVMAAAPGAQSLRVNANLYIGGSNLELRFYEGANYVGFEAPALIADQIWVLPDADGVDGDVMFTDGAGNLKWGANASTRAFTFSSPSGGSGTIYAAGHYRFGSTDNDFNPSITFGTVNAAYGDHIFIVAAAGAGGGTDTVIRVTGTSITDAGVRSAADTEDLIADDAGAAGAYYETSKKWIGQVTIEKQSGPDLLCNYGGTKYWDDNNEDFKIEGVEVTWLGGANDADSNLLLRHHKATGWTYNNGSTPTPPTAIATMNTDYATEIEVINGEEGAWKRTNLSTNILGSGSEGIILEIITTANKAFEIGNFLVRVVPQ